MECPSNCFFLLCSVLIMCVYVCLFISSCNIMCCCINYELVSVWKDPKDFVILEKIRLLTLPFASATVVQTIPKNRK